MSYVNPKWDRRWAGRDDMIVVLRSLSKDIASAPIKNPRLRKNGAADADDVTFENVPAGHLVQSLAIRTTGGEFIAHIDKANNMPIMTLGGEVRIEWDNGPLGIMGPDLMKQEPER